ncbi:MULTISPECIES: hypothetical protein [Sphingobacterium]|uniref:Uncharacterized protein n=2 Tax=Sphingobacterium TaxID=28453 RepID=A0A4R6WII0_9SPHI|nr:MULTISPECIES: hypothetical protein [Sphingobacterium]TDQ78151.1 hypothetical protein CLV99_2129 [Sphingobacterium yanglingense]
MENGTLQKSYQELWSAFLHLQGHDIPQEEQKTRLAHFNKEILEFSAQFEQFLQQLFQEITVRAGMQEAIDLSLLKSEAYEAFFKDQLQFYRQWLNHFDQLLTHASGKCTMGLTSRQVLLFLRLARDMELLSEKQLKPYFYFLRANFRTTYQESLSYESIRKKYSQLDERTLKDVKHLLEKMLIKLSAYKTTALKK